MVELEGVAGGLVPPGGHLVWPPPSWGSGEEVEVQCHYNEMSRCTMVIHALTVTYSDGGGGGRPATKPGGNRGWREYGRDAISDTSTPASKSVPPAAKSAPVSLQP